MLAGSIYFGMHVRPLLALHKPPTHPREGFLILHHNQFDA
jgi:hypothetical protein